MCYICPINHPFAPKGVQLSLVRLTKAFFGWIPSNCWIFHHSSSFLMTLGPSLSAFVSFLSYHWLFNVATSFVNGPLHWRYWWGSTTPPTLKLTGEMFQRSEVIPSTTMKTRSSHRIYFYQIQFCSSIAKNNNNNLVLKNKIMIIIFYYRIWCTLYAM